jgi:hypothetical protein
MGRLIEIPTSPDVPSSLTVCVGDLLVFDASGGHVRSGATSLELLGALIRSVVGNDRQVLAPVSAPNVVVFRALSSGIAEIDIIVGDPWQSPETIPLEITVS